MQPILPNMSVNRTFRTTAGTARRSAVSKRAALAAGLIIYATQATLFQIIFHINCLHYNIIMDKYSRF